MVRGATEWVAQLPDNLLGEVLHCPPAQLAPQPNLWDSGTGRLRHRDPTVRKTPESGSSPVLSTGYPIQSCRRR